MRCEILLVEDIAVRGKVILEAMIAAAPEAGITPVISAQGYKGNCPLLMTYGTGHPIRRPYWEAQRRRGGRCIGWDLGYWHNTGDGFTMRATLDTDHPPQFIRPEPGDRWGAQGIELREDADPDGPIILIGMGHKSARVHCGKPLVWEARKLAELKRAYPDKQIIYRPKRYKVPPLPGVPLALEGPIDNVLKGASLIVCRHSNVAVDACIAGVPVVCEDGAAAALYGRDVRAPVIPTREERLSFLESLAYWNWKPEEAANAWTYLQTRLSN